jgi:hypothetical protein
MIAVITMITLISAFFIAQGLTRTTAEVNAERNRRSADALLEAKAALIAWAATGNLQFANLSVQPGGLPCPDTDDDGGENWPCTSPDSRIGRLPWKTIGAPDLRDASGERLWYALSDSFRKKTCATVSPKSPSDCTIINFDTQGQLSITNGAPAHNSIASNVIAIVFAPGPVLAGQSRDPANSTAWNNRANFLEGENADVGTANTEFEMRDNPTSTFNDRLIPILANNLWPAVEGVVAWKLREIDGASGKPWLAAYIEQYRSTTWQGRYPFAAAFDPGSSNFLGTAGTTEGLLPITVDSTLIAWELKSPAPTVSKTGGSGTISSINCGASTAALIDCQLDHGNASVTVTVTAELKNVGNTFFVKNILQPLDPPIQLADIPTVVRSTSSTCAPLCNWASRSTSNVNPTISAPSNNLNSSGNDSVSVSMQLPARSSTRTIRIRIQRPTPQFHTVTSPTDPYINWFIANQWYKHVYYVISPGYAPGGSGTCVAGSTCLTVNNYLPSPINDKRALLVFAGRSLPGKTRPSSTLSDYFEGENANLPLVPPDRIYDSPVPPSPALNDRVIVVSP